MENMENTVMNEEMMGDVMSNGSTIGGKIGKGLLVAGAGAGIVLLVRKAVRKIKTIKQAKKAQKEDIVDVEYTEVAEEA